MRLRRAGRRPSRLPTRGGRTARDCGDLAIVTYDYDAAPFRPPTHPLAELPVQAGELQDRSAVGIGRLEVGQVLAVEGEVDHTALGRTVGHRDRRSAAGGAEGQR